MSTFRVAATPVRDDSLGELRRGSTAGANVRSPIRMPKLSSPSGSKPPSTATPGKRPAMSKSVSTSGLPRDTGSAGSSARSTDGGGRRHDLDYFDAEKAFESFEEKVRTMDEVKSINGRVDAMVEGFLSGTGPDGSDGRAKQLRMAQERVAGLMDQHDHLGGERDSTLRRLNDWFVRVRSEVARPDDDGDDGDEADGVLFAAQEGLRQLDARIASGEDMVFQVCRALPFACVRVAVLGL